VCARARVRARACAPSAHAAAAHAIAINHHRYNTAMPRAQNSAGGQGRARVVMTEAGRAWRSVRRWPRKKTCALAAPKA
jgi:transposase